MARAWHGKALAFVSTSTPSVAVGSVSGLAPSATVDTTDADNITSGTLIVAVGGSGANSFTANGVLLGEGTNPFGVTAAMTNGQVLVGQTSADPAPKTVSGDATLSAAGAVTLTNNAVSNTKFRQSAGLSVVGNSGSSTANVADIAGTANQFLGVNNGGTSLAFETMSGDATLTSGAITVTKTNGSAFATVATSGLSSDLTTTENTFTPSISFATPGDISVSYTTQDGYYWVVGKLVFWKIKVLTSAFTWTTASGDFRINGLPFTVKNTTSARGVGTGTFQGITKASYTQFTPLCRENTTTMAIVASGSGQSNSNVGTANVASGGTIQLEMSGWYEQA